MLIDALRGAIAGAAATWLMDLVTTAMLNRQTEEVTEREEAARPNDQPALVNLVGRLETLAGVELSEEQRDSLAQLLHYGVGVVPAAGYAVLRRHVPLVSAGSGALFGLLLFAINDEYLNTRLGLAGPFDAYPVETHLRGLVGHVVFGAATDAGIELLGG